ncbi:MAG TPA: helix-turn-helix domain-containing protein [Pseudolabrys sp.]
MPPDDFQDAALGKALQKRKELQETIKRAVQELERLEEWLRMYSDLSTGPSNSSIGAEKQGTELRTAAFGNAQALFENLTVAVLREVGHPMKSPQIVQEFKRRGYPLAGNEIRTAWNRLWKARANGILTNEAGFGYWIAGEPLPEGAREAAIQARKSLPKSGVSALIKAARGTKKGRDPIWTPEQVEAAERMLLAGKSRAEVAAALGGVSQGTIQTYIPGGIRGLKEKYPDVVIPKRPYVHRPHRPGYVPKGRPRTLTPEQDREIVELRAQGKGINEICKMMGVKRTSIYAALKRAAAAKNGEFEDVDLSAELGDDEGKK